MKKRQIYTRETWQNLSRGKSIFGMLADGLVSVNELGFSLILSMSWVLVSLPKGGQVSTTLGISLAFCLADDVNDGCE